MSKTARREIDQRHTSWQAEGEVLHHLLLRAILKNNPIPAAYRINYVANFFIGPLVKEMEASFKLTRPEWIVLFCLTQQPRLNAMQISTVTGRPKTSVSGAIKLLQKKKLITRKTDAADSRRQVLHLTPAGHDTYKAILGKFVEREADVLACLSATERRTLIRLFDKMIENSKGWALPY
jgi:DNA-binding MarR family transcriptional regulator